MRNQLILAGISTMALCSCVPESGVTPAGSGGTPGSGGTSSAGGAASTAGTTSTGGSATVGCDRAGLETAVNSYLAALEAGNPATMPLGISKAASEPL